jgi:cullin-4
MNGNPKLALSSKVHKKLVIRPFRVLPFLPNSYETDTWEKLSNAVKAILTITTVNDSLEELYRHCQNLCHHKKQQPIYNNLVTLCTHHIQQIKIKIKVY